MKGLKFSQQQAGRRNQRSVSFQSGRHLQSIPITEKTERFTLDLGATLKAGLLRHGSLHSLGQLQRCDLRQKAFQQRRKALIIFVVDASESMGEGTLERMKAAKGALLGWLLAAYQQRDQVALVAFRGQQAEVLLQPTSSVLLARQSLRQLPVGGATPFADGLWKAWQLVRNARQKQPQLEPLVVVVSDGEANVPLVPGAKVLPELFSLAEKLGKEPMRTIVVDSSSVPRGNKNLRRLAAVLGGHYQQAYDLHAGRLFEMIRAAENQD
jgi:magnesium chelatase subunit D